MGDILAGGNVMGKGMEWEKVKSLWDISQDWLESDMYEGEYYKIRQKKVN